MDKIQEAFGEDYDMYLEFKRFASKKLYKKTHSEIAILAKNVLARDYADELKEISEMLFVIKQKAWESSCTELGYAVSEFPFKPK